ncbi:VOC family protein [Arthrobacter sp. S41]|uniref:VOC family protein n=1 Tax=Arthrobacter sp. S41 TaxID=2509721 RepID=UPI0010356C55|nr:VOC family protein [Arthrobacter sp. S41]TAP28510.1 VOC family protein [Arthrobacter sp. S41]
MTSSKISLGAINMTADNPQTQATFWAAVTGNQISGGGDSFYLAPASADGFGMFFQPATGPRLQSQDAHMDLTVPWGTREEEVQRVIELGATHKWDVLEEFEHVQWTTLADPEGNLFCIAEHPPVH